jgi:hypothetical protein
MATLVEIVSLWGSNNDLAQRFMGGCIKAAWDVMNEAPETANHANRLALARKILLNPEDINRKYYLYFLSNASIQTNGVASSDNDILFVVASFFDTIANTEAA